VPAWAKIFLRPYQQKLQLEVKIDAKEAEAEQLLFLLLLFFEVIKHV